MTPDTLVCYLHAMARDIYEEIVELRARGLRASLATIIAAKGATPRKDSARMLVYEDGRRSGTIGGGFTEADVCREAVETLKTGKPKLLSYDLTGVDHEESALVCGGFMQVYVEPVVPDPVLFIFGAGFVSRAVAHVARFAGFRIALVDDRSDSANPQEFGNADDFYVAPWEDVFGKLPVNSSSYIFIATRGHRLDLLCLRYAVQSPARYVGILGSSNKTRSLFDILEKEGIERERLERTFVPVGLDIGSETAEEIAISFVAELIAVRKNLAIQAMRDSLRRIRNQQQ